MAKTSNLREFQEGILLKLKQAAAQGDSASNSRLGVKVGDKYLLIHLRDVREVLPMPAVLQVPLTQAWFLGVANIRGNLYNVSDLAHFIGLPATPKSSNNRVVLLSSDVIGQAALLIEQLVGLRNTESMQTKTLTDKNKKGVFLLEQYYEDVDGNFWYELDVEALVQDKEFIQPTII